MEQQLLDECIRAYIVSKVDITLVSHNSPGSEPGSLAAWKLFIRTSTAARQLGGYATAGQQLVRLQLGSSTTFYYGNLGSSAAW